MDLLDSHLLSLLIVLPLIAALIAAVFPKEQNFGVFGFGIGIMLLELALSVVATLKFMGQGPLGSSITDLTLFERYAWAPSLGISYAVGVDGLSMAMVLLTAIVTPICLIYSMTPISGRAHMFVASLLALQSSLVGVFVAADMLLFYVFYEAMLLPVIFMILVWGGRQRLKAAMGLFLYTFMGSMLLLCALITLVIMTQSSVGPSFLYSDIVERLARTDLGETEWWFFMAMALAFAIKVPMVPCHGWLKDAYLEAPAATTAMLSGVMAKVGAFALLRYAFLLFPRAATTLLPIIVFAAAIGVVYGACLAFVQTSLKGVVAFASLSHMGLVVLGLCSMEPVGLVGMSIMMVHHGITTNALFLLGGLIFLRARTYSLDSLGGMAKVAPNLCVVFVFVAMASMGLPGLSGFVGEFMILLGAFRNAELGTSTSVGNFAQGAIAVLSAWALFLSLKLMLTLWQSCGLKGDGDGDEQLKKHRFGIVARVLAWLVVSMALALLFLPPLSSHMLPGVIDEQLMLGGFVLRPLLTISLSILPFHEPLALGAIIATTGSVLGAAYFLRAIQATFFGTAHVDAVYMQSIKTVHAERLRWSAGRGRDLYQSEWWVVMPAIAISLALGVYPTPLVRMVEPTLITYAAHFRHIAGWPQLLPQDRGALAPNRPRVVPKLPEIVNPALVQPHSRPQER